MSHQYAHNLYFQGAYTFSKSINNGTGSAFGDELNGLIQYGNLLSLRSNRALSDFDRTHRLVDCAVTNLCAITHDAPYRVSAR